MGTITLAESLGKGGYGEVFKATLNPFERQFAVKLLDPSPFHSDPEKARKRFIREAEILMDLRHPNITPVYGVGEHDGRPYILMEYFEGFNLHQARERVGPPDASELLPFLEFITQALGHAHQKGIIHRDIKPSNLLTRRGDARVVDFGIAQIMDPDGNRLTKTGGTPVGDAYAAPELVDNPRLLDPRCDVYSLGACWFWILTGTTPRGRNWEAALRSVKGMTKQYEAVVLKALEQLDKRYQNTEEFLRDIRALKTGAGPEASRSTDLEDDAALLLGVVFSQYAPEEEPTSVYRVEQELSGHLNRFALGMALTTLKRRGFVEAQSIVDDWGNSWQALSVSQFGQEWLESERARVEALIHAMHEKKGEKDSVVEDDIPF